MTSSEVAKAKAFIERAAYSEAIRILHELEAQDPKDRDVLLLLASCYSALGLHAMAVEHERRAAAGDADSPQVWNAMGSDLYRIGDLARSEGAYRRALELDPGLATAAYNLARVAAIRGEVREAVEALNRALALQPDFAEQARKDEALAKLLRKRGLRKGNPGRRRT